MAQKVRFTHRRLRGRSSQTVRSSHLAQNDRFINKIQCIALFHGECPEPVLANSLGKSLVSIIIRRLQTKLGLFLAPVTLSSSPQPSSSESVAYAEGRCAICDLRRASKNRRPNTKRKKPNKTPNKNANSITRHLTPLTPLLVCFCVLV
jgi:hypothetical protein